MRNTKPGKFSLGVCARPGWGGDHPNVDEDDSPGGVRPGGIGKKKKPGEKSDDDGKKKGAARFLGGRGGTTDGWEGTNPKVYGISVGAVQNKAGMARSTGASVGPARVSRGRLSPKKLKKRASLDSRERGALCVR